MRPVTVFKNDNYVPGVGYQKCEDFKGKFHGFGLDILGYAEIHVG